MDTYRHKDQSLRVSTSSCSFGIVEQELRKREMDVLELVQSLTCRL